MVGVYSLYISALFIRMDNIHIISHNEIFGHPNLLIFRLKPQPPQTKKSATPNPLFICGT